MKLSSAKKISFLILGLLVIAGIFLIVYYYQKKLVEKNFGTSEIPEENFQQVVADQKTTISDRSVSEKKEVGLPAQFLLSVPFVPQAPYGDWAEPYENACEEASIIMVKRYLNDQSLSKDQMKSEIDSSVSWQIENWGSHFDLDAEKTLQLANDYFNLSGEVLTNYSIEEIKKKIASGYPIIAPSAGRKLGNPNFRGAGPEYHMLVIIGYDDSRGIFITNDPGTRKGEKYVYKYDILLSAISGPKEDMEKAVIVLTRSN